MSPVMRAVGAAAVATLLVIGVAGGLLRAGVALPPWRGFTAAVGLHAALMMSGFFGTVVSLERAVALKRPAGFLVPLLSWFGAMALLAGHASMGQALGIVAAAGFVVVNGVIVRRQTALHTALLGLGALAWLAGQWAFALAGAVSPAAIAWWSSFLVLTVAAERLEMTRLMRRRPGAQASLLVIVVGLIVGAALSGPSPTVGGIAFGVALAALALWLLCCDIARRTVRTTGLSRYMAVCLLSGHAWLLVAGLAWAAYWRGAPTRDLALHAVGLGFLVGMVMGHAPVILPALARLKVQYSPLFYVPLALLQASLWLRFLAATPTFGAVGNAIALASFAATLLAAAWAWRRLHGGVPRRRSTSEF